MKKVLFLGCILAASIMISQNTAVVYENIDDTIPKVVKVKEGRHAILPFNSEGKICYTGVVDIPSKNQEKLYKDSKEYVLLNYTSKDFPTIAEDQGERIYIKGRFMAPHLKYGFPIFVHKTWWDVVYTVKFYFKDGKYKYEITDLFIMKKLPAKIKQQYWGYGYSKGNIEESKVIKKDLEKMYKVKRYRTRFALIFWKIDQGIKAEIANYEKYMKQENDQKKW